MRKQLEKSNVWDSPHCGLLKQSVMEEKMVGTVLDLSETKETSPNVPSCFLYLVQ